MKQVYILTPLPRSAKPPMLAVIVLWMGIVFSPFVAFTVNGRVDGSNWLPAIFTACFCLAGLVFLHVRAARVFHQLPSDVRAEYNEGRLLHPLPRENCETNPIEFALDKSGKSVVGLTTSGAWFAPVAVAGTSWNKVLEMADINSKAHLAGGDHLPTHAIGWAQIAEWQVRDDRDGPAYYRMTLLDGGYINLKRPSDPAKEQLVLDYVRAIGGRPVRLFCDVV